MSAPRSRRTEQFTHVAIGPGQVELRLRDAPTTMAVHMEDLPGVDVSTLDRVRDIPTFQDKWSVPRQPYMHCREEHIETESGLERQFAVWMDRDLDVGVVVPQAVGVRIDGIPGKRRHVVDFLVAGDRGVELWLVRPAEHFDDGDAVVFAYLRALFAPVSWNVQLFTGHDPQFSVFERLLDDSRRMPSSAAELAPGIVEAAHRSGTTIDSVIGLLGRPRSEVLAVLWFLVAWGYVTVDPRGGITDSTTVTAGRHALPSDFDQSDLHRVGGGFRAG